MNQKKINKYLIIVLVVLVSIITYQNIRFNNYQDSFEIEARQQACLYDRRANHNEIGEEAEEFCRDYISRWVAIERND